MEERVLIIGAHPDDGEIGAGGTAAAYAVRGHRVRIVNLRVPAGNGDACEEDRRIRRDEGRRAAETLGAEFECFDLPREAIRPDARLVGAFDRLLHDFSPTAVFTPWVGDSHPEHLGATRAVLASCRKNRCSVYMYEPTIPGGVTEQAFRPQKFIDISDVIERKMQSLACYESQIRNYGRAWLDAIRGRAAYRGFQMGRPYAEAFEVVKDISVIPDLRKT